MSSTVDAARPSATAQAVVDSNRRSPPLRRVRGTPAVGQLEFASRELLQPDPVSRR